MIGSRHQIGPLRVVHFPDTLFDVCSYRHPGCEYWTCEGMTFAQDGYDFLICRTCLNTRIYNDQLPK